MTMFRLKVFTPLLVVLLLCNKETQTQIFSCGTPAPAGAIANYISANADCPGNDLGWASTASASLCVTQCTAMPNCIGVQWFSASQQCWYKYQCYASDISNCTAPNFNLYVQTSCTVSVANGVAVASQTPCYWGACTVNYNCNNGYAMNTTSSPDPITCNQTSSTTAALTPTPACEQVYCIAIAAPANGAVTGGQLTLNPVGTVATFTCNQGFNMSGSSTSTCMQTTANLYPTAWSNAVPTCIQIDCPDIFAAAAHGAPSLASPGPYLAGSSYVYTCTAGSSWVLPQDTTTQTYMCNYTGVWNTAFTDCSLACQYLNAPGNGTVTFATPAVAYPGYAMPGSTASFTCATGYNMTGYPATDTSTCQGGTTGTWTQATPTCVQMQCTAPTAAQFTNGVGNPAAGPYFAGQQYVFTCNANYYMPAYNVTSYSYYCNIQALWAQTFSSCIAGCYPFAQPSYGYVGYNPSNNNNVLSQYAIGTTATFSCNTSCYLVGSSTSQCSAALTWTNPLPYCQPTCAPLTAPAFATITYSQTNGNPLTPRYPSGTLASLVCPTNYCPAGVQTIECMNTTTWSGMLGYCDATCANLSAPTNGVVMFTNASNCLSQPEAWSKAMFSCNTGYALNGSSSLTCQNTTLWSGAAPACYLITCPNIFNLTNGAISAGMPYVPGTYVYSCNANYYLANTNTMNQTYVCNATGSWNMAFTSCVVTCPLPASDPHGNVTFTNTMNVLNQATVGSMAVFTCNIGYQLTGWQSLTCTSAGTWNGSAPTCTYAQCASAFDATGNISSAGPYLYGAVYTFTCLQSTWVALNSNMTVTNYTCGSGGSWTPAFNSCAPTCPSAGITGGTMSDIAPYWTNMWYTYTCASQYLIMTTTPYSMTMSYYCNSTGMWYPSFTPCSATCPNNMTTTLANGAVSMTGLMNDSGIYGNWLQGSSLTYTCNSGYTMTGSGTVTCTSMASWSSTAPTCTVTPASASTPWWAILIGLFCAAALIAAAAMIAVAVKRGKFKK